MKATDFEMPDQHGAVHTLSQYLGKWVILYFYPKDDTPGCTKEACNFRDGMAEFQKLGAVILGVSKDSVESHKKFAEKYNLNFPILSDEDKSVMIEYKAWGRKSFLGKEYDGTLRTTYVIDPTGEIRKIYKSVEPFGHATEILSDLQSIMKEPVPQG
jgi:thioredoxin-dependent peroxiredoxin